MGLKRWAGFLTISILGCGDDDERQRSAMEIARERFPYCFNDAGEGNIEVKGGVMALACGVEFDGPVHYLDARSGELICSCAFGGTICDPGCPPPAFR
jgi:hypothetical protein